MMLMPWHGELFSEIVLWPTPNEYSWLREMMRGMRKQVLARGIPGLWPLRKQHLLLSSLAAQQLSGAAEQLSLNSIHAERWSADLLRSALIFHKF